MSSELDITFLDLEDVISIHDSRVEIYGGSPGIRDLGLLKSAIAVPMSGFGGQHLYADVFEMAAAYMFHIVQNHPFVDGNKRTGLAAALVFLGINGIEINVASDMLFELTISVAQGQKDKSSIAKFFRLYA